MPRFVEQVDTPLNRSKSTGDYVFSFYFWLCYSVLNMNIYHTILSNYFKKEQKWPRLMEISFQRIRKGEKMFCIRLFFYALDILRTNFHKKRAGFFIKHLIGILWLLKSALKNLNITTNYFNIIGIEEKSKNRTYN